MVSWESVRALVERCWSERFDAVPTAYAEQGFDVDRLPAWAELWVTSADDRLTRNGGPERIEVTVTVHLFVREVEDGRRMERLVDAAKAGLHGLDVVDDTVRVSLREWSVRDLSRAQAERDGRPVRHLVTLARGVAEEVCSAVGDG